MKQLKFIRVRRKTTKKSEKIILYKPLKNPAAPATQRQVKPKAKPLPMVKVKFLPPYKKDGRTTFPEVQKKSGVYLIKENGVIVYVGFSRSNLYKTMYRHFQQWHHNTQEVISYANKTANKYLIRIVLCTPKQAASLEIKLITKLNPRDNTNKYLAFTEKPYDNAVYESYIQTSETCPF